MLYDTTWEGSPQVSGEREDPEQALCFGADLEGRVLFAGEAGAARAARGRADRGSDQTDRKIYFADSGLILLFDYAQHLAVAI